MDEILEARDELDHPLEKRSSLEELLRKIWRFIILLLSSSHARIKLIAFACQIVEISVSTSLFPGTAFIFPWGLASLLFHLVCFCLYIIIYYGSIHLKWSLRTKLKWEFVILLIVTSFTTFLRYNEIHHHKKYHSEQRVSLIILTYIITLLQATLIFMLDKQDKVYKKNKKDDLASINIDDAWQNADIGEGIRISNKHNTGEQFDEFGPENIGYLRSQVEQMTDSSPELSSPMKTFVTEAIVHNVDNEVITEKNSSNQKHKHLLPDVNTTPKRKLFNDPDLNKKFEPDTENAASSQSQPESEVSLNTASLLCDSDSSLSCSVLIQETFPVPRLDAFLPPIPEENDSLDEEAHDSSNPQSDHLSLSHLLPDPSNRSLDFTSHRTLGSPVRHSPSSLSLLGSSPAHHSSNSLSPLGSPAHHSPNSSSISSHSSGSTSNRYSSSPSHRYASSISHRSSSNILYRNAGFLSHRSAGSPSYLSSDSPSYRSSGLFSYRTSGNLSQCLSDSPSHSESPSHCSFSSRSSGSSSHRSTNSPSHCPSSSPSHPFVGSPSYHSSSSPSYCSAEFHSHGSPSSSSYNSPLQGSPCSISYNSPLQCSKGSSSFGSPSHDSLGSSSRDSSSHDLSLYDSPEHDYPGISSHPPSRSLQSIKSSQLPIEFSSSFPPTHISSDCSVPTLDSSSIHICSNYAAPLHSLPDYPSRTLDSTSHFQSILAPSHSCTIISSNASISESEVPELSVTASSVSNLCLNSPNDTIPVGFLPSPQSHYVNPNYSVAGASISTGLIDTEPGYSIIRTPDAYYLPSQECHGTSRNDISTTMSSHISISESHVSELNTPSTSNLSSISPNATTAADLSVPYPVTASSVSNLCLNSPNDTTPVGFLPSPQSHYVNPNYSVVGASLSTGLINTEPGYSIIRTPDAYYLPSQECHSTSRNDISTTMSSHISISESHVSELNTPSTSNLSSISPNDTTAAGLSVPYRESHYVDSNSNVMSAPLSISFTDTEPGYNNIKVSGAYSLPIHESRRTSYGVKIQTQLISSNNSLDDCHDFPGLGSHESTSQIHNITNKDAALTKFATSDPNIKDSRFETAPSDKEPAALSSNKPHMPLSNETPLPLSSEASLPLSGEAPLPLPYEFLPLSNETSLPISCETLPPPSTETQPLSSLTSLIIFDKRSIAEESSLIPKEASSNLREDSSVLYDYALVPDASNSVSNEGLLPIAQESPSAKDHFTKTASTYHKGKVPSKVEILHLTAETSLTPTREEYPSEESSLNQQECTRSPKTSSFTTSKKSSLPATNRRHWSRVASPNPKSTLSVSQVSSLRNWKKYIPNDEETYSLTNMNEKSIVNFKASRTLDPKEHPSSNLEAITNVHTETPRSSLDTSLLPRPAETTLEGDNPDSTRILSEFYSLLAIDPIIFEEIFSSRDPESITTRILTTITEQTANNTTIVIDSKKESKYYVVI